MVTISPEFSRLHRSIARERAPAQTSWVFFCRSLQTNYCDWRGSAWPCDVSKPQGPRALSRAAWWTRALFRVKFPISNTGQAYCRRWLLLGLIRFLHHFNIYSTNNVNRGFVSIFEWCPRMFYKRTILFFKMASRHTPRKMLWNCGDSWMIVFTLNKPWCVFL